MPNARAAGEALYVTDKQWLPRGTRLRSKRIFTVNEACNSLSSSITTTRRCGMTTEEIAKKNRFNGVKIFSATMAQERDRLGERITEWIREHSKIEIVDTVVTQSSDEAFHCLVITLFYFEQL